MPNIDSLATRAAVTLARGQGGDQVLATDAINRLGPSPDETKKLLDGIPVAYAVTYIFGTVGSAVVLALLGPALLGIDLEAACKRYEEEHGGKKQLGGPGTACTNSNCVRSASRSEGRPSARRSSKPRCWCPTNGCSSRGFEAAARSSMPLPTPSFTQGMSWRSQVGATCW